MTNIELYQGDCFNLFPTIEDGSIDLILTDPPYNAGQTELKWDKKSVDWVRWWKEAERVIKPRGAIVVFASGLFSFALYNSNPSLYKYKWIWEKNKAFGFFNAKLKPLPNYEEIFIFSKGTTANKSSKLMNYYPQGLEDCHQLKTVSPHSIMSIRPSWKPYYRSKCNYPKQTLSFSTVGHKDILHPTQKPVELLEYLVLTYTLPSDLVLDPFGGVFSTMVACKNLNRKGISIEMDETYYNLGKSRLTT